MIVLQPIVSSSVWTSSARRARAGHLAKGGSHVIAAHIAGSGTEDEPKGEGKEDKEQSKDEDEQDEDEQDKSG